MVINPSEERGKLSRLDIAVSEYNITVKKDCKAKIVQAIGTPIKLVFRFTRRSTNIPCNYVYSVCREK